MVVVCMGVVGCGWVWLGVVGCGWVCMVIQVLYGNYAIHTQFSVYHQIPILLVPSNTTCPINPPPLAFPSSISIIHHSVDVNRTHTPPPPPLRNPPHTQHNNSKQWWNTASNPHVDGNSCCSTLGRCLILGGCVQGVMCVRMEMRYKPRFFLCVCGACVWLCWERRVSRC